MHFLLLFSLVITLQISAMQATCNKTQTISSELSGKLQSFENETQQILGTNQDLQARDEDFRAGPSEGITANPDELTPRLDDHLRSKLTATTAFSNIDIPGTSSTRHKRSLSCDQVNGNKNACCLENFYVNFTYIGWDKWILYPTGYNANYCRGQCDLSHARYYHSTLLSKYSNIVSLCCSPKQMAPLRLLYIDEDNKVHQKSIPDMVVESCDCA